jgi:soluble lytic murein transglycosylase-like protein
MTVMTDLALATLLAMFVAAPTIALAAEHVTLRNGFEMDCARREAIDGGHVRLFLLPSATAKDAAGEPSYIDVAFDAVLRVEAMPDPPPVVQAAGAALAMPGDAASPTVKEMHTMLARAGTQHHIDEDLLASVVKAESGGRANAVSRTGAKGLMQLMPGTATELGVADAFRPDQNIAGGTAYLDQLLVRYHDNAALALAAYNAGPAAVDRYRGIPPYRETRAYVARVIREFNRRKALTARSSATQAGTQVAGLK